MARKELGRREAWCLAAGTVLINALVTICILAVALPGAAPAVPPPLLAPAWRAIFVEVDPQFQAWKAQNFAESSSALTILKKVRFLGIEVVANTVDFQQSKLTLTGGSLTTQSGGAVTLSSVSGTGSKLSVTSSGLELVADKATASSLVVGQPFKTLGTTVAKVYGNVQVGNDASGSIVDRTIIYPGKTSMSWQGPKGELAKAWLGKAADDPSTKEQLSVFGTTTPGSSTRDAPEGQLVARMYGNIQLGKPASGTGDIIDRTTIYPGKVSCSWAGPAGKKQLAKAYIGKASDDPQTKDQLGVFGSATLVTSRTKPFAFNTTGYYLQN
ncbi:hypothetical protein ABPG75_003288 [Micractinium tetrahymenae]